MKLTKFFTKSTALQDAQGIIRDEMAFLLEPNEPRFDRQLLARLLGEGCNFPLAIAKPRFLKLMISGLFAKTDPATRKKFVETFHINVSEFHNGKKDSISHEDFHKVMLFFKSYGQHPGQQIATEVLDAIQKLKEEWQLDEAMFQEGLEQFEARLHPLINQIYQGEQSLSPTLIGDSGCPIPLDLARRRLYIALTTSLLRHIQARQAFETQFGSIPEVVKAMQEDHSVFCDFMKFCKERTPYFHYLASRTFWRTLETLRLERRREEVEKSRS